MSYNNRSHWTQEEDEAIKLLVSELGVRNWGELALQLHLKFAIRGRTGKQCRERWINHLDPSIRQEDWTEDDENRLFELHKLYGNSWSEIAKRLPGRTDNGLKNHFYSTVRRNIRKYNKMHSERLRADEKLQDLLRNPALAEELLRPNYQLIKKTRRLWGPVRKSMRAKRINYKQESSDEELESDSAEESRDSPVSEQRFNRMGITIDCHSLRNDFHLIEALTPIGNNMYTPASFFLSPTAAKRFVFSDEIIISAEGYSPGMNCAYSPRVFELFSPQNMKLPDFSPKSA